MIWWLSFVDHSRPSGQQLLGVAIVEACDHAAAVKTAWALGINPGGEVMCMALAAERLALLTFELPMDELLGAEAARALERRISQDLEA